MQSFSVNRMYKRSRNGDRKGAWGLRRLKLCRLLLISFGCKSVTAPEAEDGGNSWHGAQGFFWRVVVVLYLSVKVVESKGWMEHVNELADSGKVLQRA